MKSSSKYLFVCLLAALFTSYLPQGALGESESADKNATDATLNNVPNQSKTPLETTTATAQPTSDKPTVTTPKSNDTTPITTPTPTTTETTTKSNNVTTPSTTSTPITVTTPTDAPNSTTNAPNTTSTTTTTVAPSSTTTQAPDPPPCHRFDGPSFIGGIVLTLGLLAIGLVAYKFYKARNERNYHTL